MMKFTVIAFLAVQAYATTVFFGTGVGGFETNSLTGTNAPTIPAAAWGAPVGTSIWESTQTDSTNPPIAIGTVVDFFFTFQVAGAPTYGLIGLLVDDSAALSVNGTLLINNLGSPSSSHCAASQPNCVTQTFLDITPELISGTNTVAVLVSQDAGAQFGIDLWGTAEFVDRLSTQSPEPATIALSLVGLGICFLLRRKR
jgi:hypothetical protein